MVHYVIDGEGVYPIADIEKIHRSHLEVDNWMSGTELRFDVPTPIIYELEEDEYDEPPNIPPFDDSLPIPYMHNDLYEAFLAAGVNNLQVYDAVIRDLKRGIEHNDYKAFNVVGVVSAANMDESEMMNISDSEIIDADFDRLVIDEDKCRGQLLFRLAENISAIIVDERVKQEVEKRDIKGLFFYASGEWSG